MPDQLKRTNALFFLLIWIVIFVECVKNVEGRNSGRAKEGKYICRSGKLCGSRSNSCRSIRYDQLCNGHADCPCREDEQKCRQTESSCSGPLNVTNFTIPEPLPLSAFEQYADGLFRSQFIFGGSFSIVPGILVNTEYRIEKINTTNYRLFRVAEFEGTNECVQFDTGLQLMTDVTKSQFNLVPNETIDSGGMVLHWSSCPDQYMWGMVCFGWKPGQTTCPLDNMWIFLLLAERGRPTDVSLLSAFHDVLDGVGIEFGDSNIRWKLDFGANTACGLHV